MSLLALVSVLACGGEPAVARSDAAGEREVVDISASLEALLGSGVRIGAQVDPGSEAEAFARIRDAQLTPDGRFIVVLDASPPFVRVFNPDGSLETAFVARGEGPGEAELPEALAVSNDRILVLEPGRASVLTFEGELIEDRAISFWPTSAARDCGDGFLAYGAGADRDGGIVWLRSFRTLEDTPAAIVTGASPAELSVYRSRARGGSSRLARGRRTGRSPPRRTGSPGDTHAVLSRRPHVDRGHRPGVQTARGRQGAILHRRSSTATPARKLPVHGRRNPE